MLVFYEYTKEEMLDFLKSQAPHAEIHVQDAVSQQHAANGRATNTMEGQLLAYVAVSDTDDIKGVLKTARKFHLPVIPQSGDTSTVIGSDGIDGGIILSTAKLNHIKKISPDDGIAVVEPGVINGDLDRAARKQGLFYAPDPASRPFQRLVVMSPQMLVG